MTKYIKKYENYLTLFLASLIICAGLIMPYYFRAHDMIFHTSRVVGTITAIAEGQLIPAIDMNLINGFGFSINLFYGVLFTYSSVLFSIVVNNVAIGIRIVVFLSVLLSAITMYNFVKCVSKSEKMSLVVSLIYLFAPYRLSIIYTRFAAGEMLTFVFLPLIFHGLYNLFKGDGKKHYLVAIGVAGIVYSHNISIMFAAVLIFLYLLIHIKQVFKKDIFIKLFINAIFIILITLFFTAPLIQSKSSANYVAFDEGAMWNKEEMLKHTVTLQQLFEINLKHGGYSATPEEKAAGIGTQMNLSIGIIIILSVLFTPVVYKKISKEYKKDYLFLLITGMFFAYMCTQYFPWKLLPNSFRYNPVSMEIITTCYI